MTGLPDSDFSRYSIWDRLCAEDIISYQEKLDLNKGEALREVCDAIMDRSNEYIGEITSEAPSHHTDKLSQSSLELVYEAGKLSRKLASLEHAEFGLGDRVKIGLRLAAITLDVNHSLETLLYLLKEYHTGLI